MQPLHDWLLIEQFNIAEEEKRDSGIILLNSGTNLFNFEENDQRIQAIVKKQKQNKGKVFKCGDKCEFVGEGDTAVFQRFGENKIIEIEGKKYALLKEKVVLAKEGPQGLIPAPGHVLVKIRREDEDAIYKKKIKKDDGTWTELFVTVKVDAIDERRNTLFVSTGEICGVGKGVDNVRVGDLGIIDYLADSDETIIVGYEGEDKLIVITAVTTYEEKDHIVPANRKNKKDTIVAWKGDLDIISQLLGLVRDDEIISMAPYVFLAHEHNIIRRRTLVGIEYDETQLLYQRKVLSVPANSIVMPKIQKGDTVLVHDADVFEVVLKNGKVQCLVDQDVLAKVVEKPELVV